MANEKLDWTIPMEDDLRALWSKGESARGIIVHMWDTYRVSMTRNMIIGKAHRMAVERPNAKLISADKRVVITWAPAMDAFILEKTASGHKPKEIASLMESQWPSLSINYFHVRNRLKEKGIGHDTNKRIDRQSGGMGARDTKDAFRHVAPKERVMPILLDIVEETDTRVHMFAATDAHCKWPASEDIKDMHVCGRKVSIGAYCAHHASIGYKTMPTRKRQARFHKTQDYDIQ